jgi:hypothetical protein
VRRNFVMEHEDDNDLVLSPLIASMQIVIMPVTPK